jgi:transposase-like protein
MTSKTNSSMSLADFERLLDVYGGDRTRWPAEQRAAAAQLVARDGGARRLLAEAEGLDRVLERAPLPALAAEAGLADRIVAAARRSPRIVSVASQRSGSASHARLLASAPRSVRGGWMGLAHGKASAAGFLAASLIGGVLLGLSSLPQSVMPQLADLVGLDRSGYNIAHVDFDEDVL